MLKWLVKVLFGFDVNAVEKELAELRANYHDALQEIAAVRRNNTQMVVQYREMKNVIKTFALAKIDGRPESMALANTRLDNLELGPDSVDY